MRIIICGGHLTPALAVIEALPKNTIVMYAGRKYSLEGNSSLSLEYQTITDRGIKFEEIQTGRLQRKWTKFTLPSLGKIPKGFFQAAKIIRNFKPDLIIGFGGYVSVPICMIAWLSKIPFIIHEQTLQAGFANRILAPFAKQVCISWQSSEQYFPKYKTLLTGNPAIEKIISEKKEKIASTNPRIIIVGGSQGSHAINLLLEHSLEILLTKYEIVHQTGDAAEFNDFARLLDKKNNLKIELQNRYTLTKFIDPKNIGNLFYNATLVVTRAGANTIGALMALNIPALVIPLPVSQNQEQKKNAQFLKKSGLGEYAHQLSLNPEKFVFLLDSMINNITVYKIRTKAIAEEIKIHSRAIENILYAISYVSTYR